jgi:hypothetical protein
MVGELGDLMETAGVIEGLAFGNHCSAVLSLRMIFFGVWRVCFMPGSVRLAGYSRSP